MDEWTDAPDEEVKNFLSKIFGPGNVVSAPKFSH